MARSRPIRLDPPVDSRRPEVVLEGTRDKPMNTPDHAAPSPPDAAEHGLIEMHLREVRQLFDAMDPSPFREKDLDPGAVEYIVESVKELPSRTPCALVIHLDQPTGLPDEARAIGDAIRDYFARRSQLRRRDLHSLFRRGFVSLAIGIGFLVTIFVVVRVIGRLMGESAAAVLSREGLIIVGWVAMWRPLEIFLYDWWPILGEKRDYDRLSRTDVRVVHGGPRSPDGLTRILTGAGTGPPGAAPAADGPAPLPH
jgi:hypothetical protein